MSGYADFVLNKAIRTAIQQCAKLDIVIVVEVTKSSGSPREQNLVIEELIDAATRAALSYRQKALALGVEKVKIRVLKGKSAAEEIIKYQKAENLDLVVIGRRSRTCPGTSPMGTVAQRVAAFATCTVMVVRCMDRESDSA